MSVIDVSDTTAEALRFDLGDAARLKPGDVVSIPSGSDEFFRRRVRDLLAVRGLAAHVAIVKREPGRAHLIRA